MLNGVKLDVAGDRLTVTGTDLDLTIQLGVDVGGATDGATVLPARLVSDIVRSLPSGKIEVALDDDNVSISGGRSQFSVRPMAAEDFPKLAEPSGSGATLPAAELGEALRKVVRAASTDDSRPILTGVLLTAEANGVRLVATDSYRLAVCDLAGQHVLNEGQKVLVPARALNELQRLLGAGGEVTMRLGDREATFEVNSTRLTTRLIDGEFPNYRQLIPPSHANVLTVEREPLMEAIRRVKILAQHATPVRLGISADGLRVSAITQDIGNATEELDASATGDELTVAFNPEYLAAGVEACTAESVTLSTNDGLKPAILRGVGDDTYLYLLMPVRVP